MYILICYIYIDNLLKDLDGLDKFPNLKKASIAHNKLTSTKKCGLMTELVSLNLEDNQITKLPDIENLTVLTSLSMSGNQYIIYIYYLLILLK